MTTTKNFYSSTTAVSSASFQASADCTLGLDTHDSIMLLNEGTTSTQVIEFSFDGTTLHGKLDPTLPIRGLAFDGFSTDKIWFRVKSGSTGPINVTVYAWAVK